MNAQPAVRLSGLTVAYPPRRRAEAPLLVAEDISLTVTPGEFVTIIGPSGCGKSTLFSVLAGLVAPAAGLAEVQGVSAVNVPGLVGYMPQRDALLPWRTVLENVTLGPEITGGTRSRHCCT